jgi:hypothetical protein
VVHLVSLCLLVFLLSSDFRSFFSGFLWKVLEALLSGYYVGNRTSNWCGSFLGDLAPQISCKAL